MEQEPLDTKRYGVQNLSSSEIMKMDSTKRKRYMGTLTGKEQNEILMSQFLSNLNNMNNHGKTL